MIESQTLTATQTQYNKQVNEESDWQTFEKLIQKQAEQTEDYGFNINSDNATDYVGGLLLQNTTLSNFHTGINMGINAVL